MNTGSYGHQLDGHPEEHDYVGLAQARPNNSSVPGDHIEISVEALDTLSLATSTVAW